MKKRAILSVSDKSGIIEFAKGLVDLGFEIVSTGGTEKALKDDKFTGYVNLTIKGCKRKLLPCVSKNTIVIYPESVYGNFLKAKNVVRYRKLIYN